MLVDQVDGAIDFRRVYANCFDPGLDLALLVEYECHVLNLLRMLRR